MTTRRRLILAAAAVTAMLGSGAGLIAFSTADDVAFGQTLTNTLLSDGKVAIRGYDPVAYHTEGRPVEGDPAYTLEYKGATWRFASAENRDLFKADPEKYEPAYGGYCAYGAGNGYLVKIEPEAFTIADGRLYLNYDLEVSKLSNQDLSGRIALAEKNWPGLKAKLRP